MPFEKAGNLSELPPGSLTEVEVGGKPVALCNVEGTIHAIDGICPHRQGPLGQGALHGNMVVCPWHAWEFDCTTGVNDYNPAIRLDTYRTKVDGDEILIDIA
ncbi:MAG: Rieske (2Fe-2S) protein [Bryobacteraceae bacterium]|nr:Rieske (2Fe-2S) protein [Bryobacteraceae bacterium]